MREWTAEDVPAAITRLKRQLSGESKELLFNDGASLASAAYYSDVVGTCSTTYKEDICQAITLLASGWLP